MRVESVVSIRFVVLNDSILIRKKMVAKREILSELIFKTSSLTIKVSLSQYERLVKLPESEST